MECRSSASRSGPDDSTGAPPSQIPGEHDAAATAARVVAVLADLEPDGFVEGDAHLVAGDRDGLQALRPGGAAPVRELMVELLADATAALVGVDADEVDVAGRRRGRSDEAEEEPDRLALVRLGDQRV